MLRKYRKNEKINKEILKGEYIMTNIVISGENKGEKVDIFMDGIAFSSSNNKSVKKKKLKIIK